VTVTLNGYTYTSTVAVMGGRYLVDPGQVEEAKKPETRQRR
jgi:hypothetical protein